MTESHSALEIGVPISRLAMSTRIPSFPEPYRVFLLFKTKMDFGISMIFLVLKFSKFSLWQATHPPKLLPPLPATALVQVGMATGV